jgi:hypothetical protein
MVIAGTHYNAGFGVLRLMVGADYNTSVQKLKNVTFTNDIKGNLQTKAEAEEVPFKYNRFKPRFFSY